MGAMLILFLVAGVIIILAVCMICNQSNAKVANQKLFADNNCTPTLRVYNFALDEKNKRWAVDDYNYLFHIDDIINYEVVEEKINSSQITALYILIKTKVSGYSAVRIYVHQGKLDLNSATYRLSKLGVENLVAKFDQLTHNEEAAPAQNTSVADEIAKYKALLDSGAITQEEYDAKKKELLNL